MPVRVAGMIQFLVHHGRDLSARDRRWIRQKIHQGGPVSKRGRIDYDRNRRILQHCDEHGWALFLLLASSGKRICEVLARPLRDTDFDAVPATIEVRAATTKAGMV